MYPEESVQLSDIVVANFLIHNEVHSLLYDEQQAGYYVVVVVMAAIKGPI